MGGTMMSMNWASILSYYIHAIIFIINIQTRGLDPVVKVDNTIHYGTIVDSAIYPTFEELKSCA